MNRTEVTPEDRLAAVRQRIASARGGNRSAGAVETDPPGPDEMKKPDEDDPISAARIPMTADTDPEAEARLKGGNVDELASPATRGVAGTSDLQLGEKLSMDSMGSTAPPVAEVLSAKNPGRFANVVVDVLRRRVAALELRNNTMQATIAGYRKRERLSHAMHVAAMMLEKGMFRDKGAPDQQRAAARAEANRLASLSADGFKEAERLVKAAPVTSAVPRWSREVQTAGRPGSVRQPITASVQDGSADAPDQMLEEMFTRGYPGSR